MGGFFRVRKHQLSRPMEADGWGATNEAAARAVAGEMKELSIVRTDPFTVPAN